MQKHRADAKGFNNEFFTPLSTENATISVVTDNGTVTKHTGHSETIKINTVTTAVSTHSPPQKVWSK